MEQALRDRDFEWWQALALNDAVPMEPEAVKRYVLLLQEDQVAAPLRKEIEELRRASRTRADYNFRCQDCGAPHNIDTSIPSPIWNAICENRPGVLPGAAGIGMPEVGALCTLCIDERLQKAGLTCKVAEFYFGGTALSSRPYAESTGEIEYLQRTVADLKAQVGKQWTCPDCAFSFSADHTDEKTGGYSCPLCAESRLEAQVEEKDGIIGRMNEGTLRLIQEIHDREVRLSAGREREEGLDRMMRKAISRCICEGLPWCDACKTDLSALAAYREK